jgi:hypothetical protein
LSENLLVSGMLARAQAIVDELEHRCLPGINFASDDRQWTQGALLEEGYLIVA